MISLIFDNFVSVQRTELTVSHLFKSEMNKNICTANDFVLRRSGGFVIGKAEACLL